jgi:hypothetical protein
VVNFGRNLGQFSKGINNFELMPFWNDFYVDHKWQQPLQYKIKFTMPMDGNMTGPTSGTVGSSLTWNVNMTSGSGDFSYSWSKQYAPGTAWIDLESTSSVLSQNMGNSGFTIKCNVTDNYTGLTKSFSQYVNSISFTLGLTALIEAMYVAGGTEMTMTPSVAVELHNYTPPYSLVESKTATLSTAGVGTFNFANAGNGIPYYIVVKYLNTIETWSATPHSFTNDTLSYNFTTGVGQAYTDGSNPPLALHNGKYCIYSGDVNQDGFVATDDCDNVDNDASNFDYHLVNDVNGDGFVTGDDFQFINDNSTNFIQKQIPPSAPSVKQVKHQPKLVGKN